MPHEVPQHRDLPPYSPLISHFGLDPGVVFLNHGSFGACPTVIIEKQAEMRARVEREPIRFFVEDLEGLLDGVRVELGRFLRADPEGLAWVGNATEGVNTVLRSLELAPGDELLTNNHEYNACNNAMEFAASRSGARVVQAEIPWPVDGPGRVLSSVLGSVTGRTRLVLLSHITSPTGLVFPVAEIVAALNERGIDTLVDGAHAPGMVPLDIDAIDAAYYAGNCHKWMCAPKGTGFLWVRKDRRERVRPLVISHGANSMRTDRGRFRLEFDYRGTADLSGLLVLPEVIRFMDSIVPGGWPGVLYHNRDLALKGRGVLCRALGVQPPAPESMIASLASVPIPDRTAAEAALPTRYHDALQDRLIKEWGVQAPVVVFPAGSNHRLIRIAAQVYNTVEQVEYVARALRQELERG